MAYHVPRALRRVALPPLLTLAVSACIAADDSTRRGIEYRPDGAVPRLGGSPLDRDDVGLVRDFDLAGDTLYLLDRTGRVLIVVRGAAVWNVVGSFGRRGGGPGEFMTPTGISAGAGELVVIDDTRLQRFSRNGELRSFHALELPCPMSQAGVAHSRSGLFVHGSCARGGFAADTLKAVLAWSSDAGRWRIVTEDLRYTRDGSAGHIFAAANALTTARDGTHLFGTGAGNCIWTVDDTAVPPTAARACSLVRQFYAADPPPQLRERLQSGAVRGMTLDWPPTLPIYIEHMATSAGTVLVRPFRSDSVVLQLTAPARDIAVAPLDGFVGCKAGGCLWVLEEVGEVRLIVLEEAALDALAARAATSSPAQAARADS